MLVRNLRKTGDYQRAILTQEENLRLAIANDQNVSQAIAQARQGMVPALTVQQKMSKEEELTDAIAIAAKAQENLLTLYPKETVQQYLAGLSKEDMTYLNVYWNDLKPVFKNKTGLTKVFFNRILKKHIDGIVDSRGMSTVPSSGFKNPSLNELAEVKRLGFEWMIGPETSPVIPLFRGILSKLKGIGRIAEPSFKDFETFVKFLPTEKILDKASKLPEGNRGRWFSDLVDIFRGTDNDKMNWETLAVKEGPDFYNSVVRHHPIFGRAEQSALEQLYQFIGFD
jgi:hypothetical protein